MNPAPSRQEIEYAKRKMLEARQALEAHQSVKGYAPSSKQQMLYMAFKKASQEYLKLSSVQH